ncbi:MAG: dephospho-CoA kinase [Bacteroidales bacterium]|nr:dephospho-CoA kinase [Bacteroidales bacterium]
MDDVFLNNNCPLKIGLTGGIGSGKTIVADVFKTFGVKVFNADNEAKKLYSIESVKQKIKENFTNSVFIQDNNISFKKLAQIVFNDKQKLEKLNSIIHPLVKLKFEKFIDNNNFQKYIIFEAAILFQSGFHKNMDKIICVTAPLSLRIKRVMDRNNLTKQDVLKRIESQDDENIIAKSSDFIIDNSEKKLLLPQILNIHNQISNF